MSPDVRIRLVCHLLLDSVLICCFHEDQALALLRQLSCCTYVPIEQLLTLQWMVPSALVLKVDI